MKDREILKVFHNAGFDVHWLQVKGYEVNTYTDTMIISQVLNNRVKSENSLLALAHKYLNVVMDKSLQPASNWNAQITDAHKQYCAKDAEITLKLYYIMMPLIHERLLTEVLQRELDVLPAMMRLKADGIRFDWEGWEVELENLKYKKESLGNKILTEIGMDINLKSPKQLKSVLQQMGIPVEGTSDEILAKYEMDSPIITDLREYKKLQKRISAFGDDFKAKISSDGRIRGNWKSIGADTGRMSCTQPNLQGIPKIAKRYCIPEPGNKFVICDVSQAELRILAEVTKDPEMVENYQVDGDLHKRTASMILNIPFDTVTDGQRQVAKALGLGLMYGMESKSLRSTIKKDYGITLTEEETERLRNNYFSTFKAVSTYQHQMLKADVIRSLGGRYWGNGLYIPDKGKRSRINYPIQATSAEGLKEALILLDKQMDSSWKLVACVHDECVLEVPEHQANQALQVLKNCMKLGLEKVVKNVPIKIDGHIDTYWSK